MDVETRALLIGLSRTHTKLTVNLVEEGAIDSNRAVRSFRDFAKSLDEVVVLRDGQRVTLTLTPGPRE